MELEVATLESSSELCVVRPIPIARYTPAFSRPELCAKLILVPTHREKHSKQRVMCSIYIRWHIGFICVKMRIFLERRVGYIEPCKIKAKLDKRIFAFFVELNCFRDRFLGGVCFKNFTDFDCFALKVFIVLKKGF